MNIEWHDAPVVVDVEVLSVVVEVEVDGVVDVVLVLSVVVDVDVDGVVEEVLVLSARQNMRSVSFMFRSIVL